LSSSEKEKGENAHSTTAASLGVINNPKAIRVATTVPIYILMVLPAVLGLVFVGSGVLYAGGLRPVVFELSWLTFAFVLIGTSIASNAPVLEEARHLSRAYLAVFALFVSVWIYTTVAIAPSLKMASYASGIGVTAILTGLAAAALKRRFGSKVIIRVTWALFIAMLLHAPFWVWLYMLEGQNPNFDWKYRLPGYPGLRMYSYSVEAGLAAGLGLFYLSRSTDKLKRLLLIVGTTLLWTLLLWSGGRGGAFALLASVILAALFIPMFLSKMWKFVLSTTIIGGGLSLLLPIPSNDYGLLSRIDRTVNSGSLNEISSGRLTVWSDAYSLFLDRPIFGHGVAQYRHITTQVELIKLEQVHNIILESLVAFGLVGTVALAFLLGKIWVSAAIRLHRGDNLSTLPVFLIATSLLVHGLVSGTYYHIHSVLIIAISLGLLLYDHDNPPGVSKGSDDDS